MPRSDATAAPHIVNRKATHDYFIHEKLEAGIVLQGSEVKSIRAGQVSLGEGYARIENDGGLYLYDVNIAPYEKAAGVNGHIPDQRRKLLAHKREIQRLAGVVEAKGATIIPLSMYFVRGNVKVEIGVATGKRSHDKRQDIKSREADREIRRGMTRKVI